MCVLRHARLHAWLNSAVAADSAAKDCACARRLQENAPMRVASRALLIDDRCRNTYMLRLMHRCRRQRAHAVHLSPITAGSCQLALDASMHFVVKQRSGA
jgi:azurin